MFVFTLNSVAQQPKNNIPSCSLVIVLPTYDGEKNQAGYCSKWFHWLKVGALKIQIPTWHISTLLFKHILSNWNIKYYWMQGVRRFLSNLKISLYIHSVSPMSNSPRIGVSRNNIQSCAAVIDLSTYRNLADSENCQAGYRSK